LFFNKKATEFEHIFLDQPLKIGRKFIDHLKNETHKLNLIENTQILVSHSDLDIDIEFQNKNFTLKYSYIQPSETDIPFISLTIIETTELIQSKTKNLILKKINHVIEEDSNIFSILTDNNLQIEYASEQVKKILGYIPESLLNQPINSIIQEASYQPLADYINEDLKKTETNLLIRSANNQSNYYQTTVMKLGDKNQKPFFLFTCSKHASEGNKLSQNALSEIQRAKEIIDSLPGFAYRCKFDSHWTMFYLSEGFEKVTGYTINDALQNQRISFNDIIMPKYRQYLFDHWEECLPLHVIFDAEYEILTATGEHKWVWEQGYGSYDDDDNVTELHGFILDISPYKNTILHNEKEIFTLKSYLEDAKQGFVQIDSSTSIIRVNDMMITLLGNSIDIIRSQKLSDIIHPSSMDEYTIFINQLLNQNYAEAELELINLEKNHIPVMINGKKHGENDFMINVIDLSSISHLAISNLTSSPEWDNLLKNIDIPICLIENESSSIIFSNQLFQTYNPINIFESFCKDTISENLADYISEILQNSNTACSDTIEVIDNNNDIHTLTPFIKPIIRNNKINYTLVYFIDNTMCSNTIQQLDTKVKQLENKVLSKIHFYSNASNEIRTTINNIMGYSETILSSTIDAQAKAAALNTKEISKTALETISSILDLSRIESGNINFVFEPFYPEDLLNNLIIAYAPICEKKGIRLNAHIDFKLMKEIICDEILIKKSLSGILSNVIDSTQIGAISISFSMLIQGDNHWLKATISNTGVGLFADFIQSANNPVSLDKKSSQTDAGNDVEFAICLNIIELLSGTIQISNRIGIGSVLEITIPIILTENTMDVQYKTENQTNVIVATPYSDDLKSIDSILNHYQANIYTGSTGIEAAQITSNLFKEDTNIDFAFIDYNITGMSCVEVIKTLIANGCENIHVLCKHTEYDEILKSKNLISQQHIIKKPILPSTIKKIISTKQIKSSSNPLTIDFVKLPSNFTILVVEDNSINMLMLKEILSMSGATIIEASDGQEAYMSFLKNQPDLIFMDIHMPIINGFESTKMIRNYCKENLKHKNPTIVALTANTINNLKINYQSYELDGFISKPYQINDIQNCLTKFKTDAES
jgi:CheY-like chemotaxis protein/signal transduction histidine kinase/PAS domain-containing protein